MIVKVYDLFLIFEGSSNWPSASLFFGEKCKLRMIMWWRWFALAKHLDPTVCFIKKDGKMNYLQLSNTLCVKGANIACSCTATFSVEGVSQSYFAYAAACDVKNEVGLLSCDKPSVLCSVWRWQGLFSLGTWGRECADNAPPCRVKSQVQMLALLLTLNKSFPITLLPLLLTSPVLVFGYWGWREGLEHPPHVSPALGMSGSWAVVGCQGATVL